jgi:hypothetical protein
MGSIIDLHLHRRKRLNNRKRRYGLRVDEDEDEDDEEKKRRRRRKCGLGRSPFLLSCLFGCICYISYTVTIQLCTKANGNCNGGNGNGNGNNDEKDQPKPKSKSLASKATTTGTTATAKTTVLEESEALEEKAKTPQKDTDTMVVVSLPLQLQPPFCDSRQHFVEKCQPVPTNCTRNVSRSSKHGIGNALTVHYVKMAVPILTSGCRPVIDSASKDFELLDYVRIPEAALQIREMGSDAANSCAMYSITQPQPSLQKKIDEILLPSQQHLPLVALHVRTGWADEMDRREWLWKSFNQSVCSSETVAGYATDPLGDTISDISVPKFSLDNLLTRLGQRANSKYGKKKWRFFVASDAPAVKRYASNRLKGNFVGANKGNNQNKNDDVDDDDDDDEALMTHGLIAHNRPKRPEKRTSEEIEMVNLNAMTDLIVLSESSLLAYLTSKYPRAAHMRSQCPQEILGSPSHPRHDLASMANVAAKFVTSPWFLTEDILDDDENDENYELHRKRRQNPKHTRANYNSWKETLESLLPQNSRSCLESTQPMLACLCWVKRGHA